MNIKLIKPEGTDIYNISVFNDNSTTIEDAFKSLDDTFEDINLQIEDKYNYYDLGTLSLNNNLATGIYGISSTPPGKLPDGITNISAGFLLAEKINDDGGFHVMFIDEGIFYRWYPELNWKVIKPINVIDTLNSQSETDALSAKQGYILNNTKLSIYNMLNTDININNCDEGIYIGNQVVNPSDSPVENVSNFILECYGPINSRFQRYNDKTTNASYYRWGNENIYSGWSIYGGDTPPTPIPENKITETYVNDNIDRHILLGSNSTSTSETNTVYKGNLIYNPNNNQVDYIWLNGGTID